MSARELQLLRYFLEHDNVTPSRQDLLTRVWGYSASAFTRTVDVHVAALWQKLEDDPKQPRHLLTVQGVEYSEACQCAWFRYYPVLGSFSRDPLPIAEAGLPINWYSWLLIGFLAATAGALITPRSIAAKIPHSWVWGVTAATLVVIMVYERRWFY